MNLKGFYNKDCMEAMKGIPDNYFELAIVDPPYGIGADNKNNGKNSDAHERTSKAKLNTYKKTNWDNNTPDDNYFDELKRVSKNQIIWGVNYYNYNLKGGRIYWNKNVTMPTYSDGELAYCSLTNSLKSFDYTWHGMIQEKMKNKEVRIHPTQKPVDLYKWLLTNYAEKGDKILDTHVGSASSLIACYDLGFEYLGFELDEDYYNEALDRLNEHKSQMNMFLDF